MKLLYEEEHNIVKQDQLVSCKREVIVQLINAIFFCAKVGRDFQKANFYCGQIKLIYGIDWMFSLVSFYSSQINLFRKVCLSRPINNLSLRPQVLYISLSMLCVQTTGLLTWISIQGLWREKNGRKSCVNTQWYSPVSYLLITFNLMFQCQILCVMCVV